MVTVKSTKDGKAKAKVPKVRVEARVPEPDVKDLDLMATRIPDGDRSVALRLVIQLGLAVARRRGMVPARA